MILLGKPLAALVIVRLLGHPLRAAISVAVALAQIGEFSFILAAAGKSLGLLDDASDQHAHRRGHRVDLAQPDRLPAQLAPSKPFSAIPRDACRGQPATTRGASTLLAAKTNPSATESIIVGHGPVGQTLVRLLIENRVEPVVIELNLETVRKLGIEGIRAVYGDATHRETLEQAGARDAVGLVLSSTNMDRCAETIRLARELNPTILIVARSNYLRELPALRGAGADIVFSGEGEVALAMTEFLLRQLGATAEQIDRERERIRSDLFGSAAVEATENHL